MNNPCYNQKTKTSCPKRAPGCAINCKEWAEYIKERDKIYDSRKSYNELKSGILDIGKNRVRFVSRHRRYSSRHRRYSLK